MVPARGAFKASSIFIASITISSWPSSTTSPAATRTSTTRPGIGAARWRAPADSAPVQAERPAAALSVVQADAVAFDGERHAAAFAVETGRQHAVALPRAGDRARRIAFAQSIGAVMTVRLDLVTPVALHERDDTLAVMSQAPGVGLCPGGVGIASDPGGAGLVAQQ